MPFYLQSSRDRFRRYKRELARQLKTGAAEIAPSADAVIGRPTTRHRSFFQLLGRFLGLLRGLRGRLVLALCTLTIATLLNLAPPAATKVIVDYVLITDPDNPMPVFLTDVLRLPSDPPLLLGAVALAIVGIAVVSITVGMWGRWQATKTTKRLQVAVRRRVFEHTVRLPLHRVYALKSGGVTSILREDAGGVGELVFGMVYNPWRAIIQLAGTLAILAVVDWRLLLPSLLLIPAVYLTQRNWVARVRPLHRNIRATRQHVDTHATEAFGGMRVVRAFGRQRSESNRFTRNNHLMARQELHAWWWARSVDIAWSLLIPVASAVLLWYGGRQVLGGAMSPGDLVMFLAYLAMLLGPLATLAVSAAQFQNGLAALDRVLDLLAEPVEMAPQPGAVVVQPAQVAARITLRDVGFVYRGSGIRVIDAISLDVEPGETVALVGRSGAGKTTLCNLIARFYDPIDGVIELDGTDLRDINVESYRRLLGIVEQDIFLFDGTVADNIGYARRGASTSEIVEVARRPRVHHRAGRRLRHAHRRARRASQRRPAPAPGHRPGHARRSQNPHPRRGHEQSRHRERALYPGQPRRAHARPHQFRDRPSAQHGHGQRSHRAARGRSDRRPGTAQRAAPAERDVSTDGLHAVPGRCRRLEW
jgi:ATP-binding cassette subfamily B protein/subfamily B ATP-binding cassette protein MsbA